jgi:WD40 repeat protein
MAVAISSDGKTIASGSSDLTLRLWDVGAQQPRTTLTGGGYGTVHATTFAHNGGPVAWATSTCTVKVSDPATGNELLSVRRHTGNVFCVAFAPDGNRLASGSSDGTARLWDPRTGDELTVFRGHEGGVNGVAFSPDGHTLACATGDFYTPGVVKLWTVPEKSN